MKESLAGKMQQSETGHAPGVSLSAGEETKRDRQIVTARRLDWRFLLPDPLLGHVAYLGVPDPDLQAALDQFSASLQQLPGEPSGAPQVFDLLVARKATLPEIENALPRLKSGGYLYWEVMRTKPGKMGQFAPPRSAFQYRSDLSQLGLTDLRLYWHRPNFNRCKEMIPLDRPNALSFAMNKGHTGWRGQLKETAGKLLKNSGVLPFIVPCFSIVGQKR